MDKPTCERCGAKIPAARLKILPRTKRCVNCSNERAKTAADVDLDEGTGGDGVHNERTPRGDR